MLEQRIEKIKSNTCRDMQLAGLTRIFNTPPALVKLKEGLGFKDRRINPFTTKSDESKIEKFSKITNWIKLKINHA